jgi:hypothetical protein
VRHVAAPGIRIAGPPGAASRGGMVTQRYPNGVDATTKADDRQFAAAQGRHDESIVSGESTLGERGATYSSNPS